MISRRCGLQDRAILELVGLRITPATLKSPVGSVVNRERGPSSREGPGSPELLWPGLGGMMDQAWAFLACCLL